MVMSVNSKMTAIADAIRGKTGGTNALSLDDMAEQIANISTGVELNFEVVGGISQPSNPKENTIWVNTNTAITDWVFSATQPTAANGRVWISTGTESVVAFNALKEDSIQVYPISAKQYISGAWVNKTAISYQGGEWVGWITYLYNFGDECTDITGGWTAVGKAADYDAGEAYTPKVTKDTTSFTLSMPKSWNFGMYYTNKKIDLTYRQTITAYVSNVVENDNAYITISVWSNIGTYINSNKVAEVRILTGDTEASLDLSTIPPGSYYVGFAIGSSTSEHKITVKQFKIQ